MIRKKEEVKMKEIVSISIDQDLHEKFMIALNLNKETEELVVERCIKEYIKKSFVSAASEYSIKPNKKASDKKEDLEGFANRRIPMWAMKPNQYNHKIIRAFLLLEKNNNYVRLNDLEDLCNDSIRTETYVPTFRSNYSQMKFDGPKSHGKVFEDDGDRVWIWSAVEDTLNKYKEYFVDENIVKKL